MINGNDLLKVSTQPHSKNESKEKSKKASYKRRAQGTESREES